MEQASATPSLRPVALPAARLSRALGLGLGILALIVSARIRVPLPWTPVPVTLQDLVALLCGALLGPQIGVLATATYLGLGLAGLPVFAAGAGLAYLAGPTGGYLLGFVAAAALVGVLRPVGRSYWAMLLVLFAGEALIHAVGVVYLSEASGMGLRAAFVAGSLTFWPITAAKLGFLAAALRSFGRPLARSFGNDVD